MMPAMSEVIGRYHGNVDDISPEMCYIIFVSNLGQVGMYGSTGRLDIRGEEHLDQTLAFLTQRVDP